MRLPVWLLMPAALVFGQGIEIEGSRIRTQTRFLANDLMEGRGVGTRGDRLATEYLATQLELFGVKPAGDNGTFYQHVPLVGVETQLDSSLSLSGKKGSVDFRWLDEFVGVTERQEPQVEFDTEVVFAGHGITAPEFGWDDYQGVDVRGKAVVVFTNEPPSTDPKFFGGPALTYYGRWTYKYENALRKGALACLIIHTTPTAGYGWEVLRSSAHEDPQVKLAPGEASLALAGWMTQEAGSKLAAAAGLTVEDLLASADKKGFRAFPLGVRIHGQIHSRIRPVETRNVAGLIPGSDPSHRDEVVVYTAHWDHLGIGEAINGDRIYNGAVDNATGCAMILEIAHAWSALQQKPPRSALFLFFTAEEAGLRGATYYAQHPLVPPGKTAFGINIDAFYPAGRTRDIVTLGADRTTALPLVERTAKQFGLTIHGDPRPEQGSYYRSDHFALAHVGIPAISLKPGTELEGRDPDAATAIFRDYNTKRYHQPGDEFQNDWDFSGLEQGARFAFTLGVAVAEEEAFPTWQPGDEFLPARAASGVH
jgi:Zn-dependent M28 family amino/carboxypeptidase